MSAISRSVVNYFQRYSAKELRSYFLPKISTNVQFLHSMHTANSEFVKSLEITEEAEGRIALSKDAFETMCKEYDSLTDENADLRDKYTRSLAETENVRRRLQKQLEDAKLFAVQGFCKDLLEVADILNLAVESLEKNKHDGESDANLKGIHEGVHMTKNVLLKTFSKHGLEPIFPEGQKFDPNLHDAIFEVQQDQSEHKPGHVHHVMKVGYSLHNRPIRPAKVGVVKS